MARISADSPEAKQKIHRQATKEIRKDVLTKHQRRQLRRETAKNQDAD
jgi:hypothetical protein